MSPRLKHRRVTADHNEPEPKVDVDSDSAPGDGNSGKLLFTVQRTDLGRTEAIIEREANHASSRKEGNQPAPLQSQNQTTTSEDEHETTVPEAIYNLFKDNGEELKQLLGRAESAIKDTDVQLVTLSSEDRIAFWNKARENAKNCRDELKMFNLESEPNLRDARKEWNRREAEIRKKQGEVSKIWNKLSEIEDSLDKRMMEGTAAGNHKREREEDEEKTGRQNPSKKTRISFKSQSQPQSEGRRYKSPPPHGVPIIRRDSAKWITK